MAGLNQEFSQNNTIWTSSKTVALFIDVQDFTGLEREDAIAYKNKLSKNIEELRQKNIPVIWVAISKDGVKLLKPSVSCDANSLRDFSELEDIGFVGHREEFENSDLYADFMHHYGPRKSEVVYRKPSMSALAEATDIHQRDEILEEAGVKLASRMADEDHPETKYITVDQMDYEFNNLFNGKETLNKFLKENSISETIIFGAVSYYCVSKTAESAVEKGFKASIASDMVLSWQYSSPDGIGTLVWGGNIKNSFNHASLILQRNPNLAGLPVVPFAQIFPSQTPE